MSAKPTQFLQTDLRIYQRRFVKFALRVKRSAGWIDMRLGKTASALTVIARLLDQVSIYKAVVFVPDFVASEKVWPKECKKWEHLQHLRCLTFPNDHEGRRAALKKIKHADVVIVTYYNLLWFIAQTFDRWPFDHVTLDESAAFKNTDSKRFHAMKEVIEIYNPRMIQLTGTPTSSAGLQHVYAQMYLLDNGKALGTSFDRFRRRYFESDYMGFKWTPYPETKEDIYEKLSKFVFRLDAKDYKLFKPLRYTETRVALPPKLTKIYKKLEREFILEFEDAADVEAVNKAVLSGKLLQFSEGATYDDDKKAHWFHELKLDALEDFLAQCNDRVLLAYGHTFSKEAIKKRFPYAVNVKEKNAIRNWQQGKIDLLTCHPGNVAHGLDLWGLAGAPPVSHTQVWYGNTPSIELNQQFEARLKHPTQTNVHVHRIVVANTRDSDLVDGINSGITDQYEMLDYLNKATKARIKNK